MRGIAPKFYSDSNTVRVYGNAKRNHFLLREHITYVGSNQVTFSDKEDIYTLASSLFGRDSQFLWYVLAETNRPLPPDEYTAGDKVNIPIDVISDEPTYIRKYNVNNDGFTSSL
jgi:hypothetical protein